MPLVGWDRTPRELCQRNYARSHFESLPATCPQGFLSFSWHWQYINTLKQGYKHLLFLFSVQYRSPEALVIRGLTLSSWNLTYSALVAVTVGPPADRMSSTRSSRGCFFFSAMSSRVAKNPSKVILLCPCNATCLRTYAVCLIYDLAALNGCIKIFRPPDLLHCFYPMTSRTLFIVLQKTRRALKRNLRIQSDPFGSIVILWERLSWGGFTFTLVLAKMRSTSIVVKFLPNSLQSLHNLLNRAPSISSTCYTKTNMVYQRGLDAVIIGTKQKLAFTCQSQLFWSDT